MEQERTKATNAPYKQVCYKCAAKKKKCDETRPECGRCAMAGDDCRYPPPPEQGKGSRTATGKRTLKEISTAEKVDDQPKLKRARGRPRKEQRAVADPSEVVAGPSKPAPETVQKAVDPESTQDKAMRFARACTSDKAIPTISRVDFDDLKLVGSDNLEWDEVLIKCQAVLPSTGMTYDCTGKVQKELQQAIVAVFELHQETVSSEVRRACVKLGAVMSQHSDLHSMMKACANNMYEVNKEIVRAAGQIDADLGFATVNLLPDPVPEVQLAMPSEILETEELPSLFLEQFSMLTGQEDWYSGMI